MGEAGHGDRLHVVGGDVDPARHDRVGPCGLEHGQAGPGAGAQPDLGMGSAGGAQLDDVAGDGGAAVDPVHRGDGGLQLGRRR